MSQFQPPREARRTTLNLPAQYTLGSGTTALVTHTYYGPDASGYPYGALKTIQLQQGANPRLVDRDLAYDKVGNVTSIADAVNSETITYSYDDLDRLLSASAPSGESYTYNEIGNIASKNSLSCTYDTAHKHAIASYNGTSYGYDANGNMTTRGDQRMGLRSREPAGAGRGQRPALPLRLRWGRRAPQAAGRQRDDSLRRGVRAQRR